MTDEEASAAYGGDFAAIEAAVLETPRGRWFLGEFARRNRIAETDLLLQAIRRLESNAGEPDGARPAPPSQADLASVVDALNRTKTTLAEIGAAKTATSDILKATERLQELAWELRETGAAPDVCDELDRGAAQIYTACAFQELMAERVGTALEALRAVEDGLMLAGSTPAPATAHDESAAATDELAAPSSAPTTTEVDAPLPDLATSGAPSPPIPAPPLEAPLPSEAAPVEPVEPRAVSLDKLLAIDRLDFRERVRLFT